MIIGTWFAEPDEMGAYSAGAVTGTVTISDNEIDMTHGTPLITFCDGIRIAWTTGITADITRNTILNCSRNAIEASDNYRGKDGQGVLVIQDNKITTPQLGIDFPTPSTPNGIVAGYFLDSSAGTDPARYLRHVIVHNTIKMRGKTSLGISVLTDRPLVRNNDIVAEGTESIAIFAAGSESYIGQNRVAGSGKTAIALGPFASMTASRSAILENQTDGFTPAIAHIRLGRGASDNVVIGQNGSVLDEGSRNQVKGLKNVTE